LVLAVDHQRQRRNGPKHIRGMTRTSVGNLNYAFSRRIKQLSYIRKLGLWVVFHSVVVSTTGASKPPEDTALQVTVTGVRRVRPDEVEIHIALKNVTDRILYIPTYGTSGSLGDEIQEVTIYQWEPDKGWRPLGSRSELPSAAAKPLGPREVCTFVRWLSDPIKTPRQGEGVPVFQGEYIPLRGRHKVTVGFYASKEDWEVHGKQVEAKPSRAKTGKISPPGLKRADSQEFEIPGTQSQ
jgi:hypothetical protein